MIILTRPTKRAAIILTAMTRLIRTPTIILIRTEIMTTRTTRIATTNPKNSNDDGEIRACSYMC